MFFYDKLFKLAYFFDVYNLLYVKERLYVQVSTFYIIHFYILRRLENFLINKFKIQFFTGLEVMVIFAISLDKAKST